MNKRRGILPDRCPNLLLEAGLYRYDPRLPNAETPIDEHNHAMDALRYLVSSLDAHHQAKPRKTASAPVPPPTTRKQRPWLRYDNEALWTRIF